MTLANIDLRVFSEDLQKIINYGANNNTIGVFNITGDSMQPILNPAGKMIVDFTQKDIKNGDIYLFRKPSRFNVPDFLGGICNKLTLLEDGRIKMHCENSRYKPNIIDSIEDIEIIGKVIAANNEGSNLYYAIDSYNEDLELKMLSLFSIVANLLDKDKEAFESTARYTMQKVAEGFGEQLANEVILDNMKSNIDAIRFFFQLLDSYLSKSNKESLELFKELVQESINIDEIPLHLRDSIILEIATNAA